MGLGQEGPGKGKGNGGKQPLKGGGPPGGGFEGLKAFVGDAKDAGYTVTGVLVTPDLSPTVERPSADSRTTTKAVTAHAAAIDSFKDQIRTRFQGAANSTENNPDLERFLVRESESWPKLYHMLLGQKERNKLTINGEKQSFSGFCSRNETDVGTVLGFPDLQRLIGARDFGPGMVNPLWISASKALRGITPFTPEGEESPEVVKKVEELLKAHEAAAQNDGEKAPASPPAKATNEDDTGSAQSDAPAASPSQPPAPPAPTPPAPTPAAPTPADGPPSLPPTPPIPPEAPSHGNGRDEAIEAFKAALSTAVDARLYSKVEADKLFYQNVNKFQDPSHIETATSLLTERTKLYQFGRQIIHSDQIRSIAQEKVRDCLLNAMTPEEFATEKECLKGLATLSKQFESGLRAEDRAKDPKHSKHHNPRALVDSFFERGVNVSARFTDESFRLGLWLSLSEEQRNDTGAWKTAADQVYKKFGDKYATPKSLSDAIVSTDDINVLNDIGQAYFIDVKSIRERLEAIDLAPSKFPAFSKPTPDTPPAPPPPPAPTPPTGNKADVIPGDVTGERDNLPEWTKAVSASGQPLDAEGRVVLRVDDGKAVLAYSHGDMTLEVVVSPEALATFDSLDAAKQALLLKGFDASAADPIDNDYFRQLTLAEEFEVQKFVMPAGKTYEGIGLNLRCAKGAEVSLSVVNSVVKISGDEVTFSHLSITGSSTLIPNLPGATFNNYFLGSNVVSTGNLDGSKFLKGRNEADMVATSMLGIQVENFGKAWKGVRFNFNTTSRDTFQAALVRECTNYKEMKLELNKRTFEDVLSDENKVRQIIRGFAGVSPASRTADEPTINLALEALSLKATDVVLLDCPLPMAQLGDSLQSVLLVTPHPSDKKAIEDGELRVIGVVAEEGNPVQMKHLSLVNLEINLPERPETTGVQYALAKYLEWLTLSHDARKKFIEELDLAAARKKKEDDTQPPPTPAPSPNPGPENAGPTQAGTNIFQVS